MDKETAEKNDVSLEERAGAKLVDFLKFGGSLLTEVRNVNGSSDPNLIEEELKKIDYDLINKYAEDFWLFFNLITGDETISEPRFRIKRGEDLEEKKAKFTAYMILKHHYGLDRYIKLNDVEQ